MIAMTKTKVIKSAWGRAALYVLLLMCLIASAHLAYMAVMERLERKRGDDFYLCLAASSAPQQSARVDVDMPPAPLAQKTPVPDAQRLMNEPIAPPPTLMDSAFPIDFDSIRKTCPDVVGWIRLEDSAIDYPIVHGANNDFYLHHLPDRTPNQAGSIMMDAANSGLFRDEVNILHGHNMKSGAMFGGLDDYRQEAYYQAHKVMSLQTPMGNYDVLVFAAFTVNGYTFDYNTSFADALDFERFVERARAATPYETGVFPQYGDQILLLSTCAYTYAGARFVVMGKMVESTYHYVMF